MRFLNVHLIIEAGWENVAELFLVLVYVADILLKVRA